MENLENDLDLEKFSPKIAELYEKREKYKNLKIQGISDKE